MNWSTIIWIAVAVILYLVGIYEGRGQGYKKRKAEDDKEKTNKALAPIKPITVDDPGVMRIKNENGRLTLDLDGTRVDTNSFSADQRKRLIETISSIRPWLEGKPAPAPITGPLQPQPQPQLQQPIAPPPSVQPINPPAPINPFVPKPATIAKEDRPSAPATSMIGQIDSILQEHLAGTPLEERGVFLAQSPDGGVIVYVGLTKYMAIDDVPDAEVIAAIRTAIKAWENKYTPGLK
jgi:hypothetical protein